MMRAQTRRDREPLMKASMLGLAISTVAFGTGAIYLWSELAHERDQLATAEKANAALNARILELESRGVEFSGHRMGGPGTFEGALAARTGPGPGPGAFAYVLSPGAEVREQNLVIRIARADLTSARDGDLDRLRQRAQINRY